MNTPAAINRSCRSPVMNVAAEHHLGPPPVREVMGGLNPALRFSCPRVRDTDTVCILYVHDTGDSADGPESAQDIEHRRRDTQAGARVSRAGHRDGGDRPAGGRPCLGAQAPRGPPFSPEELQDVSVAADDPPTAPFEPAAP